jgi:hypothetical protein
VVLSLVLMQMVTVFLTLEQVLVRQRVLPALLAVAGLQQLA